MFSNLAQIREETDQKSDGDWFFRSGSKLSRCRRGLCSDVSEERSERQRGRREESGERRGQELEKITKQNKQTNKNGRRIGEEDRIWKI